MTTLKQDILKWHIGEYKDNSLFSKTCGRVFNPCTQLKMGNHVQY